MGIWHHPPQSKIHNTKKILFYTLVGLAKKGAPEFPWCKQWVYKDLKGFLELLTGVISVFSVA